MDKAKKLDKKVLMLYQNNTVSNKYKRQKKKERKKSKWNLFWMTAAKHTG